MATYEVPEGVPANRLAFLFALEDAYLAGRNGASYEREWSENPIYLARVAYVAARWAQYDPAAAEVDVTRPARGEL